MRLFSRFASPSTPSPGIKNIATPEDCRDLFTYEKALIFKHSRTCGRSDVAYRALLKFCETRPQVSIYLITVPEGRAASTFIEEQTGVEHESPQLLLLSNGRVLTHASHWAINTAYLESLPLSDGAEPGK